MYDLEDDRIDRLSINHEAVKPELTSDQTDILDALGEEIMTQLMDQEADATILEKLYEEEKLEPSDL
jgi:hypothetical protein